MIKTLLTEPYVEITDLESLNRLKDIGDVCVAQNTSEEELVKDVKDASALIVRFAKISKKIIDNGETLKIIGKTGTGVDNIDIDAATKRRIFVCNVPAINADSVAEYTFVLILALIKNLIEADKRLRIEGWVFRDQLWPHNIELNGKVIGIIGLGVIGTKVSNIAKAFGMKVFAYDPYVSSEKAKNIDVKLIDFDTLLSVSDIVTIHCALTDETKNLINQNNIEIMKRTAFLINCARGPIVNQDALINALKNSIISGAALDVFESEPVTIENPLLKMKNVIATPHIAGMTYDVRLKTMEILVNDIINVLNGETPKNLVNPQVLI